MRKLAVIDTNVVVSGAITTNASSPTAWILDAMLKGGIMYLLSGELLAEYSAALCRPKILRRHQLCDSEINAMLANIVLNSVWREPVSAAEAPDAGDSHLWRLLAAEYGSILVTGDKLLLDSPPTGHSVISPRDYTASFHCHTIHEPAANNPQR